jgi:hypothetical protein
MANPMTKPTLPPTDSIQELARFWDTQDVTDFDEQLEELGERVFERNRRLSIELPANAAESIRSMAKRRGVKDTELVRQWVLEKAAVV